MSGILGIGIDLCGIERMRKLADDPRFLDRYFTEGERAYVRSKGQGAAQTLAGLFAAKEAVCKALGTGIAFSLRDIEVFHTELGQPQIRLTGAALERASPRRTAAGCPVAVCVISMSLSGKTIPVPRALQTASFAAKSPASDCAAVAPFARR